MELTNDFRVALPIERAWAVLTDLERIAPCMPGAQLQEIEGDDYRGIVKIKVGPITAQYKGQATFLERNDADHVAVLRAEGRETRGQGNASATITATLTSDGDGTAVTVLTDLTVTGRVAQFGRGVLADISAKLLDQFVASLEQMVLADESTRAEPAPPSVAADAAPEAPAPDADAEAAAAAGPQAQGAGAAPAGTAHASGPETSADRPSWETPPPHSGPGEAAAEVRSGVRKVDSPEAEPVDLLGTAGSPVVKRVGPIVGLIALAWLLKRLFGRKR